MTMYYNFGERHRDWNDIIKTVLAVTLVVFIAFLIVDGVGGAIAGKVENVHGRVYDKQHDIHTDKDGNQTHYYRIVIDPYKSGQRLLTCDSSKSLYDSVKAGDSVRVIKYYGWITGWNYKNSAENSYQPSAER